MRAVGYVRISKADRDKTARSSGYRSGSMRPRSARPARPRAGTWLRIVDDYALSGNDDDRPAFAAVAALVDAGDVDVVVVPHVDRLYRKGWRLLWLVDPVAEGGAG